MVSLQQTTRTKIKMPYTTGSPPSLYRQLLTHAERYLGLIPEYLKKLEPGLCFGLAAAAAIYHTERRFQDFLTALTHIKQPINSLLARELIERCLFLQAPHIQSKVTGNTQKVQSFVHVPLLSSAIIDPIYLQLSIETLKNIMLQSGQQPNLSTSILLSVNQTHTIALIYYTEQWWLVDSLESTTQVADINLFAKYGIEPGKVVNICVTDPHTSTLFARWQQRYSDYNLKSTDAWPRIHFGNTCTSCKETKSGKFRSSNIEGVLGRICERCWQRTNRLTNIEICANCEKEIPAFFRRSNIEGVQGRVCDYCWRQTKRDNNLETCVNCKEKKSGEFRPSKIEGVPGRVCGACWQRKNRLANIGICANCKEKRSGLHPSNIEGVPGRVCDKCWRRTRSAAKRKHSANSSSSCRSHKKVFSTAHSQNSHETTHQATLLPSIPRVTPEPLTSQSAAPLYYCTNLSCTSRMMHNEPENCTSCATKMQPGEQCRGFLKCGQWINPGQQFCNDCYSTHLSPFTSQIDGHQLCPRCKHKNLPRETICTHCFEFLSGQQSCNDCYSTHLSPFTSQIDGHQLCPRCKYKNLPRETICTKCFEFL